MPEILKDLKPYEVFKYFEELSRIPRGSGNEREVSSYLVNFAKRHQLDFVQDKDLNVVIKKPATPGYESSPPLIIQGHMDMVCEKNSDSDHDFTRDPLNLRIVDDMIYATGTTLGADNGIAVAFGLAILASSEYPHPSLEVLVTTSEETGMDGAMALDPSLINGRILINIDSEEEGKILAGCAGGVTARTIFSAEWESVDVAMAVPYLLKIRGLMGGHSGMEIGKERGNANKLLGRLLVSLLSAADIRLSMLNGGAKHNAIAREADAVIWIKSVDKSLIEQKIHEFGKTIANELRVSDPGVRIELELLETAPDKTLSRIAAENAVNYLYLTPNGVASMSMDVAGLVESSSNLGVVCTGPDHLEFICSIRSSVRSLKQELVSKIAVTATVCGGSINTESDYPEWAYDPNSKIRAVCESVFEKLYGKRPQVSVIHAGLECGLFSQKFEGLDAVSFGPDIHDVHTPNEHVSIASVQRTWNYLLEVLKHVQ